MPLGAAVTSVPAGRWGVAVSGGADSVALLRLLCAGAGRGRDVVVVHLNHQLRGSESDEDARFVEALARELGLASAMFTRLELEQQARARAAPAGALTSAQLRDLRLCAYRAACQRFALKGVILAHHADDVAETLIMRLLRGSSRSGTLGLAPLRFEQVVHGVRLLRPLLRVRRKRLRRFLNRTGAAWREDASNLSMKYGRNRVRQLMADRSGLADALLVLSAAAADAEAALESLTPALPESPRMDRLLDLPAPVRRRALRRWLVAAGLKQSAAGPRAIDAVLELLDAAGPRSVQLAADLMIRRDGVRIVARRPASAG